MTDQELLHAIQCIVEPLKENIQNIKEQLTSNEKTEADLQEMVAGLNEKVLVVQQKLNEQNSRF